MKTIILFCSYSIEMSISELNHYDLYYSRQQPISMGFMYGKQNGVAKKNTKHDALYFL